MHSLRLNQCVELKKLEKDYQVTNMDCSVVCSTDNCNSATDYITTISSVQLKH